jgi:hypothetical protein
MRRVEEGRACGCAVRPVSYVRDRQQASGRRLASEADAALTLRVFSHAYYKVAHDLAGEPGFTSPDHALEAHPSPDDGARARPGDISPEI